MDNGQIGVAIVMGFVLVLHGGLIYLIVQKKYYGLLSGFANRPEEEKAYLMKHGFITAVTKLLTRSFWLVVLAFLMLFIPIPYGFEMMMFLLVIGLLIALIWIQRYEVPEKRKKSYWITGLISGTSLVFVLVLVLIGFQENDIVITNEQFLIKGVYDVEWELDEIETVEWLDELPAIKVRTNGFAAAGRLKGSFRLEGHEDVALLFINGQSERYLYVATGDAYVIFNRSYEPELEQLYQELMERIDRKM